VYILIIKNQLGSIMIEKNTIDRESQSGRKNYKLEEHSESFTNITHTSQRNFKSRQS
jgi:hypothetical protein